jgi:hypothetical protein
MVAAEVREAALLFRLRAHITPKPCVVFVNRNASPS